MKSAVLGIGLGLCLVAGILSGCGEASVHEEHGTAAGEIPEMVHAEGAESHEAGHANGDAHETGHAGGAAAHEAGHANGDAHEMSHAEGGKPTLQIALTPTSLKPGVKASMTLSVTGQDGKPVTLDDLKEAHTKKIHLLLVDPSLSDYHHIHPTAAGKPGTYGFEFTPAKSGAYKVFADLVPVATGTQEYDSSSLTVEGEAGAVEEKSNVEVTVAGLTVSVAFEKPELVAGAANMMTLTVTGPDAKPFTGLEPIMGAYAHLVAFNTDRSSIAHVHPMGEEPKSDAERGGPALQFHLNFGEPGYQKLFAQFQIAGKDVYAPFGLQVLPGEGHAHGDEGAHTNEHASHGAKIEIPETAEAIMSEVDEQLGALDSVVAGGELEQVHEIAFAIRDLLVALPGAPGSVSPDASPELETALGKIRQQAELLDKYGDAGNAAQTKTVLVKFKSEIEGIKSLLASQIASADAMATEDLKMANNTICPISGSEVGSMEKGAHVDFGGYRVGLCCSGCVEKFMKDPDAYLKKSLASAK